MSATGLKTPQDARRIAARVAHAEVEFKKFRIMLPHVQATQIKLDAWREVGRRTVGQEQKVLAITGPSHSGKSTIVKGWCERIAREEAPTEGSHPVLHVSLANLSTVKSMAADILNGLGRDALPPEVVEETIRRKDSRRARTGGRDAPSPIMWLALRSLVNAGTELLIIDEVQHLARSDTAKETRWAAADALKWLAIMGPCPVVCVGIRKVIDIFGAANNPQLSNRNTLPVIVEPLDVNDKNDAQTFGGYVESLDTLMVRHGILHRKSDLADKHVLPLLYDVSLGILGRVSRLVEAASEIALMDGREKLASQDLSDACERYAMRFKLTDRNPWRDGTRDLRLIRRLATEAM